ncbi:hypothetical protein PCANC_07226 [Puccinia coronata f. sp. avenae]|uniref:Uncharacterized protein n=1 Tax=Puccinia coronata f. sp. avenae TaxID=200324 RepID=A0A2N5VU86_9BASI|nr:hypothetical protein PCASD_08533 [Puccinia coronata f. sp. avenae]PLW53536.1 hypothetical protein PCANC_07226 [Puccinia coronata f. sp. avenae]
MDASSSDSESPRPHAKSIAKYTLPAREYRSSHVGGAPSNPLRLYNEVDPLSMSIPSAAFSSGVTEPS